MTHETSQELFWKGKFGDEYSERNVGEHWLASNLALFSTIFKKTGFKPSSVLELGPNIGLNLMAINHLLPGVELSAVEINEKAGEQLLKNLPSVDLQISSILDFKPRRNWDLVFTKGVLIHMDQSVLDEVYDLMFNCSSKFILVSEYYNPVPVEVTYRGHSGKLFKRDFAGELLDRHSDLRLIDYGFVYHRDSNFPQDDMNWFLLAKN